MNRDDLRTLAQTRLKEAESLLQAGLPSGAYYLAGYAVECALKACVASQTKQYDFPDKQIVIQSYTHNLNTLIGLAGLRLQFNQAMGQAEFSANWSTVKDWSEEARYDTGISAQMAQDLFEAIAGQHGVLQWVQQHW